MPPLPITPSERLCFWRIRIARRRSRRQPHTGGGRNGPATDCSSHPTSPPPDRIQRQLQRRHRRPQRRRRPDRAGRQGLLRQLAASPIVDLVADHLGTIRANSYVPAIPSGAPDRKVDTRIGVGGGPHPTLGATVLRRVRGARRRSRRQSHTGRGQRPRLRPARLIRRPRTTRIQRQLQRRQRRPQRRRRPDRQRRPGLLRQLTPRLRRPRRRPPRNDPIGSAYVPANASGAPDRKVDTRIGSAEDRIPPSGRRLLRRRRHARRRRRHEPDTGRGRAAPATDCSSPPTSPTSRSHPTSTTTSARSTPTSPSPRSARDGQVCFANSSHCLRRPRRRPPRHDPRQRLRPRDTPAAHRTAKSTPASASTEPLSYTACVPATSASAE